MCQSCECVILGCAAGGRLQWVLRSAQPSQYKPGQLKVIDDNGASWTAGARCSVSAVQTPPSP
eukprot:6808441-Ditylum_brightwellii.AAC.1